MNNMAETVIKKSNAAEKETEKRAMQYADEKDRKAEIDDKRRKNKIKDRDNEIKQTLDKQLEEKRKFKAAEFQKNKEYVAQVIAQDEREKVQIREKQQKHKERVKDIAKFQRVQMGEVPQTA